MVKPLKIVTILGPTASGKTRLAVELAKKLNGAIISADSRQVYKGMDIGTGKDLQEYEGISYYLIDNKSAGDSYHVADFQRDFHQSLQKINQAVQLPILCGGTGFYIQSVLGDFEYVQVPVNETLRKELEQLPNKGLLDMFNLSKSEFASKADVSTRKRLIRAIEIDEYLQDNELEKSATPEIEPFIIGIDLPLNERRERITARLHTRLRAGMVGEVESLIKNGLSIEKLVFYGLEYKYIAKFINGELTESEMISQLNTAIHRYAKRQMTYFRKMEKDGLTIHWIDGRLSLDEQFQACMPLVLPFLEKA